MSDLFRIGEPADHCLKVMARAKITMTGPPVQVPGTPEQGGLIVRWPLSNGITLTFERRRGVAGRGSLCYRVTKIEGDHGTA